MGLSAGLITSHSFCVQPKSVTCDDSPSESAAVNVNTFRQLTVNIGAGGTSYVFGKSFRQNCLQIGKGFSTLHSEILAPL